MEKIRCLYIKPYELPEEIEIDKKLEAYQKLVKGYIECINLDDVVLICNDEGKINNMPLNRDIGFDIIAGPFLIVGDDYERGDFKSLTDEQILNYKTIFGKESIVRTENKIAKILMNKKTQNMEMER